MCERVLETEQSCNILTPTLLAITAFLSRSPGLLNRGPGGPASLDAGFLYCLFSNCNCSIGGLSAHSAGCWLSLPHLVSNCNCSIGGLRAHCAGCWLSLPHLLQLPDFLSSTGLYNSSTSTFFLWASQITLIQPVHGQGYNILIFLNRMYLLFTQVHFLFWRFSWVVGQCATVGTDILKLGVLLSHDRLFLPLMENSEIKSTNNNTVIEKLW